MVLMFFMLSGEWGASGDFSDSLSLGVAFDGFERWPSRFYYCLLSFDGFDVFDAFW